MPENSNISIGAVSDDIFNLSTASGARAISTLGLFAVGDRSLFDGLGIEGSIRKVDAEPGKYSIDWLMRSKDYEYNDSLFVYNGREVIKVADRLNGTVDRAFGTSTFEVPYDSFYIAALDVGSKSGTTDFTVLDIERRGDLDYTPPVKIDLQPSTLYGDINVKDRYIGVATGGGDKSIRTMARDDIIESDPLFLDPWISNATEGSIAKWENLDNGLYDVTGYIFTTENDINHDVIGYWKDDQFHTLIERSQATTQLSRTRFRSDTQTHQIEVNDGKLTLLALDTYDKTGTTEFRVQRIERVSDLPEPEPMPDPFPMAEDGMGNWSTNSETYVTTFSSDGVSTQQLEDSFFRVETSDYGVQGTAVLLVSDPGLNQIEFKVDAETAGEDQLLLWDGEKFLKAIDSLESGTYTINADMVSDEWGFALLDRGEANGNTTVEITDVVYDAEYRESAISDIFPEPDIDPTMQNQPEQSLNPVDLGDLLSGATLMVENEFVGNDGMYDDPGDVFLFESRDRFELEFDLNSGSGISYEVLDEWDGVLGSGTYNGEEPFKETFSSQGNMFKVEILALSESTNYDMSVFAQ